MLERVFGRVKTYDRVTIGDVAEVCIAGFDGSVNELAWPMISKMIIAIETVQVTPLAKAAAPTIA